MPDTVTNEMPPFKLDLLPEDIRGEPMLKDFKDWGALAKSYVHAGKMVGLHESQVLRLNKDGTPTPEVWARLGKPEKYDFPQTKMPIDDGVKAEMADFANKQNFTKAQFEEWVHLADDKRVALTAQAEANSKTQREAGEKALKEALGEGYEQTLNFAKDVPELFEKPALWDKLDKAGLTRDPEVINFLGEIGRMAGEDHLVDGSSRAGFAFSPAEARSEINTLKGDKNFMSAYTDSRHPGHKDAVARLNKLYQAERAASGT